MLLKTFEVKKEWVDYNNHMNMAYYVLVFDQAWEVALEKFKMGGTAAKNLNRSTMVVETNTKYLNEVKEGCLLYTSPSPRDGLLSRMPSSA